MNLIELTVTLKGETPNGDGSTYKQKFLLYDPITLNNDDPTIIKCLQEATSAAKIKVDTTTVKTIMRIQ